MSNDRPGKIRMMQGNQACAEGAVAAGCRFFAGYPITPSSEIAENLSVMLPRLGGKFIQMEDRSPRWAQRSEPPLPARKH